MSAKKSGPWSVVGKKFVLPSGMRMAAGCHHCPGRVTACGGCYARMSVLLDRIQKDPGAAAQLVEECTVAMRAEKDVARAAIAKAGK